MGKGQRAREARAGKKEELKKLLKDDSISAEEKLQISAKIFQELKNQ